MKKIKKLKLINWHFFEDEEIDFSDINVITGENGTGKSTILDAIHYLLSGGTCKFNTAANTLSHGRTVENYLKARIGIENKEFLRDQADVICHIAIEFEDTLFNKPYVLGCVIQLVSSQLSSVEFYEIKGDKWNDKLFFTDENKVRSFDSLIKEAIIQRLNISKVTQPKSSERQRAKDVRSALGIPEKYETLFSKALSFEPLNDINKFAIDFLLPETEIDLSTIKGSMDNYRYLQEILKRELNRKELLEPIFTCKERYETALKEKDIYELLQIKGIIESEEDTIKSNNKEIEIAEATVKSNKKMLESLNNEKTDYDYEAKKLENDPAYNALNEAKKMKDRINNELSDINNKIEEWKEKIDEESKIANEIGTSLSLQKIIEKKKYEDYISILANYRDRIDLINKENEELWKKDSIEREKIKQQLDEVNNEISSLEQGNYDYPRYVNELINSIRLEVLNKKGVKDVRITPLCNFLDIVDEEWRYAIEGYLDRSRFDLIIKKDFISVAKECFDNTPDLKAYFGVGVVASIPDSIALNENSLANKVEAVNENNQVLIEPTNYIRFLLNDIICVESTSDFVDGQKAITKEGVFFDGHALKHVNDISGNKCYLGQESLKIRLENAKTKKAKIVEQKAVLDKMISKEDCLREKIKESNCDSLRKQENLWEQESNLRSELENAENSIEELLKNNDDLLYRDSTISNFKKLALEKLAQINGLNLENERLLKDEIGAKTNANEASRIKVIEKQNEYKNKLSQFDEKFSDGEAIFAKYRDNLSGKKLFDFALQRNGTASSQIFALEQTISKAMSDYCHSYPNELKPDISNYNEFVKRYNKIINDDLAKLEPDVENARIKSVQELREHFISKIRKSLTDARKDVADLNKVLKKHPFGTDNEVFEFYTQKSKDPLLAGIFRIAMDTNQDTVENNILTDDLDEESQAIMAKVFEVLSTNEDDVEYKKLRKELLDYRNYLNYDIKINISNTSDVLFYSKNQDSKSGGETQTPFYALIAGAFQSVVSVPEKNRLSPCSLVVFDEAFNNMDGERIKQMLEFYKELNIQLIISVPSSRFGYISPFADNIISLAKVDNSVAIFESVSRKE